MSATGYSQPYSDPPYPDEDYVDFYDYMNRLRRRLPVIVLVFIACMVGAVYVSRKTPVQYESSMKILFPAMGNMSTSLSSVASAMGLDNRVQPIDMYTEVLKSATIVEPIAKQFGVKYRSPEAMVKVQSNSKAGVLTLTAVAPTGPKAAQMANAYSEALRQFIKNAQVSSSEKSAQFLATRVAKVRSDLQAKENELKAYQQTHQTANLVLGAASGGPGASSLPTQLVQVTTELQGNAARLREIQRQLKQSVSRPNQLMAESPLARKWRDTLTDRTHDLALAQTKYGPEHPQVLGLKKDIQDIRNQIANEIANTKESIKAGITPEMAQLLAEQEALTAQKNSLTQVLSQIPAQQKVVTGLVRDIALQTALYTGLQQKFQEAQLAQLNDPSRFVVLDSPTIPKRPSRPRWKMNLALGGIVGLFLSGLIVLAIPERRMLAHGSVPPAAPLSGGGSKAVRLPGE